MTRPTAGAVAPSTRAVEKLTNPTYATADSCPGGQGGCLRNQMVDAAAAGTKRTVNALCDIRQTHLGDFADGTRTRDEL